MDQTVKSLSSSAANRRAARLAKGYSFEELAIATGLTVAELRRLRTTMPCCPSITWNESSMPSAKHTADQE